MTEKEECGTCCTCHHPSYTERGIMRGRRRTLEEKGPTGTQGDTEDTYQGQCDLANGWLVLDGTMRRKYIAICIWLPEEPQPIYRLILHSHDNVR